MKLQWKYFIVGMVCAGFAVQAAMAGAILIRDEREVDILLDVTDEGGTTISNPAGVTVALGAPMSVAFDTGEMHAPSDGASGQVIANQISSFDASPEFLFVSAEGYSWSRGSSDDFVSGSAQADADSDFEIEFTLSSAMDFTLSGFVTDGSASTGRVRLRPTGGADVFLAGTTGDFDTFGTLEPGNYELIANARTGGFASQGGSFNNVAEFGLEFTLVPEPTTALLTLIGCLFVLRRRTR